MRKVLLIMTLLLTIVAQGAWADGTIDITPSDKNKVLCTDGSIYNNVSAAEADSKTPVAKIIVVDTENHKGLALALSDEGQMNYSNALTACDDKNTLTPVTNATWAIPSKDEWDQMLSAAGSYTALRDGFSGIGGTNISNVSMEEYWTRTRNMEYPNLVNWTYDFSDNYHGWKSSDQGGTAVHVRLCLQFNLPIPTHNAALADGTPTGWSITPTTPEEGSTVTVSYTGQHRVKSVKVVKKVAGLALNITSPSVGQVIGNDGKNYAAGATLPSGVTKVAMIAYVSGSNGLAIALADEGSLNWATAKSTCEAKTPAFTGGTWHLPTQAEWNQMFSANGGSEGSYTGLNTAITTAGGTVLQVLNGYWSSTPDGPQAYYVYLDANKTDWRKKPANLASPVRACIAF